MQFSWGPLQSQASHTLEGLLINLYDTNVGYLSKDKPPESNCGKVGGGDGGGGKAWQVEGDNIKS